MAGWIKMHRKILDNPIICKDSDYLSVWIYLLLNATHKEIPALFKGKKITLKKGQLITGRKSISDQLKISESKIYRIINDFKSEQQIEQQTSNKNSLITILNWDRYQQSEHQDEQQMNNKRTTNEQQMNTNKNVKNVNNNIYKEIEEFTTNPKLIESINEFIEYRKKKKKELSELALKKILNQFRKWDYAESECIESINNSIMNGWTGIFEIKNRHEQVEEQNFKEIDTSNLTEEEYIKLVRGEKHV